MSRKQHTTLTLAVTVPVPVNLTQAATIQLVEDLLRHRVAPEIVTGINTAALTVKLIKKDTVYL